MNIKRKATIVYCKDITVSKDFYTKILGFAVEMDLTSVIFFKEGIAIWQVKEGHLLKEKLGSNFNSGEGKKFELYFEVHNWQEFVDGLKNYSIEFLHETHQEPWGQRTIRFYDPDKNIVEIAETLEDFISRMHNEGMSAKEIAKKNEISIEEVENILRSNHE